MILGAQAYTIRKYAQTPEDIEASFKKLSDIGYTSIQVSGFGEFDPAWLNEVAAKYEMKIAVTHYNAKRILEDTDNVAKEHLQFGCKNVGIGAMPDEYNDGTLPSVRRLISEYSEAARKLQQYGIKLHYHNHQFEFEKFDGLVVYDVLLNETVPELWGFIPDTYWIQYAGRCPSKQIEAMKNRIVACHLKNMIVHREDGLRMVAIGEGNLYWDEILDACEVANVEYLMVEQDHTYDKNPFDELKISFDYIKMEPLQPLLLRPVNRLAAIVLRFRATAGKLLLRMTR